MGQPAFAKELPARDLVGRGDLSAPVAAAVYVPRPATVRALSVLRAAVTEGAHPAVLRGPGGMGKTLLLRMLARRVEPGLLPIYIPVPTLPQSELCALALGLAGQPASAFPDAELLDFCGNRRADGRAVLLLIDDAGSMCPEVARGLAGLAACSHGALRIALAVTDDARSERILVALGRDAVVVPLEEPMSPTETERYLRGRLARTLGPNALDRETCARLHAASGGVPGELLHSLLEEGLERP